MKPDTEKVLSILAAHGNNAANLIAILQDVQAEYNYLSEANLTLIADTLDISVSRVYSVATFYENFSLEAKGKHIIKVCAGTACHVRKSGPIYDAVYEYLGLSGKKKTSDDGLFTLETVACLGACGLAPVMTIDGEVHAKMDPETALALLEDIRAMSKRVIEDEDGERQRYLAIKANERKQQTEDESRLLKQAESRLAELDTIISKTYEERMLGKLSEDLSAKMLEKYTAEQKELTAQAEQYHKARAQEQQD